MGNKCQQYYYYQDCKSSRKERKQAQQYQNCQPVQYSNCQPVQYYSNCQPTQACADIFTPSVPKINNLEVSKPAESVKDHYKKVITFNVKAGQDPNIIYSGTSSNFQFTNWKLNHCLDKGEDGALQFIKERKFDHKTQEWRDHYTLGVKHGYNINFKIGENKVNYDAPFTEAPAAVQPPAAVAQPQPEMPPDPMGQEPIPVQPVAQAPVQPTPVVPPVPVVNPPTKIEVASGRADQINSTLLDIVDKEYTPGTLYGKNQTKLGKEVAAIRTEFTGFIKDGMAKTNPLAMEYLAAKLKVALIKNPSTDEGRNKALNQQISSLRQLAIKLKEINPTTGGEIITKVTVEDGTANPNDAYKITSKDEGIEVKANDRWTSRNDWQKGITKKLEAAKDWKGFDHVLNEYIKPDDGGVTFDFIGK